MLTCIIGGGLSGLALAEALHAKGEDVQVLEARNRIGGRILTLHEGAAPLDMGPAWFWPGQPRIAALTDRMGLDVFEQFATGDLVFEDARGPALRGRGHAPMAGSLRVRDGLGALTRGLAAALGPDTIRLGAKVVGISLAAKGVCIHLENGTQLTADRVVLALPPRIAATLDFSPALPQHTLQHLQDVPTWMAGQAKAIAVYDSPFWREDGLSGDATSRRGPMVEIHDASPAQGGPFALFGFIGIPPHARQDTDALRAALLAQFTRLFGPQAQNPIALHVKDWACDPYTSVPADLAPLMAHPTYAPPPALGTRWRKHLYFCGTEVATKFGGFAEGALEAAEATLHAMTQ